MSAHLSGLKFPYQKFDLYMAQCFKIVVESCCSSCYFIVCFVSQQPAVSLAQKIEKILRRTCEK